MNQAQKLLLFCTALGFAVARTVSKRDAAPEASFDDAEAFIKEAKKRDAIPDLPEDKEL